MSADNWVILALSLVWFVAMVKVYGRFYPPERHFNWARFIARVAIFGAISTVLYVVPIFQVKIIFLPTFLELHFDEIPAFVAGFAYGPLTGFAVLFIKTLIKLPFSSTLTVGEWSDLLYSSVYVLSASFIYEKKRNLKGVALGFTVGTLLQIIVTSFVNVTVTLPFYMELFGMSYQRLLQVCQAANPAIKDLTWSYILYVNLPLNAIKDAIVIVATFLIYRSIHKLLRYDSGKI